MTSRPVGHSEHLEFAAHEPGFFDKSIGIRVLIGVVFTTALFFYLHFREVRVEVMEVGSVAPHYMVAQVDFAYYDEEATIIHRQEAVRDIGKVYQIDEGSIRTRRADLETFLRQSKEWRERLPDVTFEEIYRGLDLLENEQLIIRFTDPRTLKKMEEADINTSNYLIFAPPSLSEEVALPSQIWSYMQNQAFKGQDVPVKTAAFIVEWLKTKTWKLDDDSKAQTALRKRVQAKVPDKYTKVSAGSRIIDQGEKVSSRHTAMLQAMKEALSERRNLWHPLTLLGSLVMAVILTAICATYLQINQPQVMASNRQLFLLVTIIWLSLGFSRVVEYFLLTSKGNLLEIVRYPLLVPLASILLCSLMNSSIAAFATGFLAVVLTMTLPFDRQGFMLTNLAAALVAIFSVRSLRRRKEIFLICAQAWLSCAVVILAMHLYEGSFRNGAMIVDLASTGVFMLITAVLVVGLLPLFESGFNIMTNVTLMEYMDPDHLLLRRMTMEAPGTYQHSIVVGNLAEACAAAIGANGLFCRVATLFHDIGKMVTPQYFTENQQGGMDIHQLLTPLESAQVIMAHVTEGVAMARKAGLPERFIDIIKEHHGTTLVYYFYRKQLETSGDPALVDEREFRYAGPKPRSRESAIIMIADSFEAASRSIDRIDEESLYALVSRLIREKAEDGQFDECQLTYQDIHVVKRTMVKTLVAAGHSRVKYPKRDDERMSEERLIDEG